MNTHCLLVWFRRALVLRSREEAMERAYRELAARLRAS